jgi:C4-type Zn-finger protein
MPKAAATGVDVAAVEAHLARYVVSCPLCKAVDQLGVGQHLGRIESANGAKDSISTIVVVCKRCGYLMPLAADLVSGDGKAA